MTSSAVSLLAEWDSFCVIVGSSAGALIGLQFVVMTLMAERQMPRSPDAGGAFGSPTVVHFSVVLFLSALFRAPWESVTAVTVIIGLFGVGGLIYAVIILRRMLRQTVYHPVLEDWVFHLILPVVSCLLFTITPLVALSHVREALFGGAAASLLLLFVGIHNAWDAVSFQVFFPKEHAGATKHDDRHPPR